MSELFSTFGVDWKLLLTQMINFGVLLFVLKRYAYGPVLSMLQKRKEIIAKGLDDSAKAEKSLLLANENAEEIKKNAKTEANSIISEAQNEAWQFSTQTKNEALQEKSKIVNSAQSEIESIKNKNELLVKQRAVDHIISGIRSILKDEINPEMNERIISKLVTK